ncbi:MAG: PHP domain-containing protein [Chloroflexi bacterium]|nr:PHP domain-containing protein [Chloroflexota bacterium]
MGRADLHIHTSASDGSMNVRELLDHVAKAGTLDVIAITDHDRLDASVWAFDRRDRYPFDIVPGVEVSTAEGHMLALWVTEPVPSGLSMAETAAAIHEQNGVAILAHPFFTQMGDTRRAARVYRRDPAYLLHAGLDGLETFNGSVILPGSNAVAACVARLLGLGMTGGSDAHSLSAVGTAITHFKGRTADDLRNALLHRQTRAVGRPWPLRAHIKFVADFIARRGRILLDEFDGDDKPERETATI